MILCFAPEATQELIEARSWYDERREGLGDAFQHAFEATTEAISLHPEMFQIDYGSSRRAFVRGFPYFLLYRVVGEVIFVQGCIHVARNPSIWRKRVDG